MSAAYRRYAAEGVQANDRRDRGRALLGKYVDECRDDRGVVDT